MEEIIKKKYEEALEKARMINSGDGVASPPDWSICEIIFPELKEGEDERIRKFISNELICLRASDEKGSDRYEKLTNAITWLEKQCEQKTVSKTEPIVEGLTNEFQKQVSLLIASAMDKEHEYTKGYVEWVAQSLLGYAKNEQTPTNKVEPKFKVGDWCVNNEDNTIFQIILMLSNSYYYRTNEGKEYSCTRDSIERDSHIWTIQDAKDGDVLATDDGSICLFDGTVEEGIYPFAYCGLTRYGFESYDRKLPFTHDKNVHPATKEQRILLFSKMGEAGYEWDAEKKELKKIEEQNLTEDNCKISDCDIKVDMTEYNNGYECGKQRVLKYPEDYGLYKKSAWSEEDEKKRKGLIKGLEDRMGFGWASDPFSREEYIDWLKSLKNRVQPQPKQEWSEEDEKYFNVIYKELESYIAIKGYYTPLSCADLSWLKSLKERMKGE